MQLYRHSQGAKAVPAFDHMEVPVVAKLARFDPSGLKANQN